MFTEGMKSSEFAKSAMTFVVGLVLLYWGIKTSNQELIEYGALLTGGANLAYAIARGLAKMGNTVPAIPVPAPAPAEPKPPLSPEEAAKLVGGLK